MEFIGTIGHLISRIQQETGQEFLPSDIEKVYEYFDLSPDDNLYTEEEEL